MYTIFQCTLVTGGESTVAIGAGTFKDWWCVCVLAVLSIITGSWWQNVILCYTLPSEVGYVFPMKLK